MTMNSAVPSPDILAGFARAHVGAAVTALLAPILGAHVVGTPDEAWALAADPLRSADEQAEEAWTCACAMAILRHKRISLAAVAVGISPVSLGQLARRRSLVGAARDLVLVQRREAWLLKKRDQLAEKEGRLAAAAWLARELEQQRATIARTSLTFDKVRLDVELRRLHNLQVRLDSAKTGRPVHRAFDW